MVRNQLPGATADINNISVFDGILAVRIWKCDTVRSKRSVSFKNDEQRISQIQ